MRVVRSFHRVRQIFLPKGAVVNFQPTLVGDLHDLVSLIRESFAALNLSSWSRSLGKVRPWVSQHPISMIPSVTLPFAGFIVSGASLSGSWSWPVSPFAWVLQFTVQLFVLRLFHRSAWGFLRAPRLSGSLLSFSTSSETSFEETNGTSCAYQEDFFLYLLYNFGIVVVVANQRRNNSTGCMQTPWYPRSTNILTRELYT